MISIKGFTFHDHFGWYNWKENNHKVLFMIGLGTQ